MLYASKQSVPSSRRFHCIGELMALRPRRLWGAPRGRYRVCGVKKNYECSAGSSSQVSTVQKRSAIERLSEECYVDKGHEGESITNIWVLTFRSWTKICRHSCDKSSLVNLRISLPCLKRCRKGRKNLHCFSIWLRSSSVECSKCLPAEICKEEILCIESFKSLCWSL